MYFFIYSDNINKHPTTNTFYYFLFRILDILYIDLGICVFNIYK